MMIFSIASFTSLLALGQREELVDLPKDYPLSASEDEVGDNCSTVLKIGIHCTFLERIAVGTFPIYLLNLKFQFIRTSC